MRIGKTIIGPESKPLMIAEEGQANQGNVETAKQMCLNANEAGADGIEFQFFLADDMYIKSDPGWSVYRQRELKEEAIIEVIRHARDLGLLCQIAGLSPKIISLCSQAGADLFCVNASDLTNPEIIDAVIASGRPFWLATLMATLEEIDWAVSYVKSQGAVDFGILHGQHIMTSGDQNGVPPELLQLDCISMLQSRYGVIVGFVDHTATTIVPSLAVTKGACLVTKHLSPNAEWRGPDWQVCLPPDLWREAKQLMEYSSRTGGSSKELSQLEVSDRSLHRRSIYTRQPMPEGSRIQKGDLIALRPGKGGIDPREIGKIEGKRLTRALPGQYQLQQSDLTP
jgi:N,N'-diacetyllegionaminate synthase